MHLLGQPQGAEHRRIVQQKRDEPNRFIRWSRLDVFDRIFAALVGEGPRPERLMVDVTHLKAHRTAASLLKKGMFPAVSGGPKAD